MSHQATISKCCSYNYFYQLFSLTHCWYLIIFHTSCMFAYTQLGMSYHQASHFLLDFHTMRLASWQVDYCQVQSDGFWIDNLLLITQTHPVLTLMVLCLGLVFQNVFIQIFSLKALSLLLCGSDQELQPISFNSTNLNWSFRFNFTLHLSVKMTRRPVHSALFKHVFIVSQEF